MKKTFYWILVTILSLLFIYACSPSPEAIATMTAAAWTSTPEPTNTPEPTPTPTPLPYDLTVKVMDENSEPISLAHVQVVEAGDEKKAVDESGEVKFMDVGGESITLDIASPGYFLSESMHTIQRGENTIEVTLELDPNGLLPENACAAGETLIMVEDMQDQGVEGWSDLSARLESGAPGVEIIDDGNNTGNWVLKAYNTTDPGHIQIGSYPESLGNAVLRFRTRNNGEQHLHVGSQSTEASRYIAFIYADQSGGRVDKFEGDTNFTAFNFGGYIGDGEWHTIEISSFDDVYEIWIDGQMRGSWQDKQPLGPGNFFLDADFWKPDRVIEFDDISICEMTAPFTSILAE